MALAMPCLSSPCQTLAGDAGLLPPPPGAWDTPSPSGQKQVIETCLLTQHCFSPGAYKSLLNFYCGQWKPTMQTRHSEKLTLWVVPAFFYLLIIKEVLVSKRPKANVTWGEGGLGAVGPVLTDVLFPSLKSQIRVQGGGTGKETLLPIQMWVFLSDAYFQQVLQRNPTGPCGTLSMSGRRSCSREPAA